MTTLPTTTPMRLPRPAGQAPLAVAAPAHAQSSSSFQMTGSDVWRVIRSNIWLIIVMLVLSIAGGFALNWYLAKYHSSYTAYGFIEVNGVRQFHIIEREDSGTDVTGLAAKPNAGGVVLEFGAALMNLLVFQDGKYHRKCKEDAGGVLRGFGQEIAGARPEQGVGGRGAKRQSRARLLLRQLHQYEQDQHEAIQHQEHCQQTDKKSHIRRG